MTQRQDTPVRRLVEDLMTEDGGDTIRLLLERMLNRLPGSRASRATFRHCPVSAQKAVRAYVTAIASLDGDASGAAHPAGTADQGRGVLHKHVSTVPTE